MVNYKNSNEHYVANYILYGYVMQIPDTDPLMRLSYDIDGDHPVTANEFEAMFYGAPVYVRVFPDESDSSYLDGIVVSFAKSEDDAGGYVIMGDDAYRIAFDH